MDAQHEAAAEIVREYRERCKDLPKPLEERSYMATAAGEILNLIDSLSKFYPPLDIISYFEEQMFDWYCGHGELYFIVAAIVAEELIDIITKG